LTPLHPETPYTPLFFLLDAPPPDSSTLSLHDALPISSDHPGSDSRDLRWRDSSSAPPCVRRSRTAAAGRMFECRKSLSRPRRERSEEHTSDSSHVSISYAVFCLKKKKERPNSVPPHRV